MISHRVWLLKLIFFFLSTAVWGQNLSVNFFPDLVIGEIDEAPKEYLFSGPEHISTDNHNNIYVADRNSSQIRVFDEKGKFLKYIGRRGQGPGEFIEISCILITTGGELLVSDRVNRRVTRFSLAGDYLASYRVSEKQPVAPRTLLPLGENAYVAKYIDRNLQASSPTLETIEYVHIYDKEFKGVRESIVKNTEIWDMNILFEKAMANLSQSINLASVGSNKILVSPLAYSGEMWLYEFNDGVWHKKSIFGKQSEQPAYQLLENFQYIPENRPAFSWIINTPHTGRVGAVLNRISIAVWQLRNGEIVHFVVLRDENEKWNLGMELFHKSGQYKGYGLVDNFEFVDDKKVKAVLLWKDIMDRFYFADYQAGFPVIRRMSLSYQANSK